MKNVVFDNLVIGEGTPKICVPIVAAGKEEAVMQAEELLDSVADLIEFRGDYFGGDIHPEELIKVIGEIRKRVQRPVIYTFRTGREGGRREISKAAYIELLRAVILSGEPELVDIELMTGEEVKELISLAKDRQVRVIMSNHDFEKTPSEAELVGRLQAMEAMGADIAKIAVMPQDMCDVSRLLQATAEAVQKVEIPIVTMAMGQKGVISRILGEVFGSSITFGTLEQASAPGQLPVQQLAKLLEKIHQISDLQMDKER